MKASLSLGVPVAHFEQYAAADPDSPSAILPRTEFRARSLELGAKRAMDIAVSLVALIVLLPLLLAVAVLIKLESPGPVFFRQARWGKDCKVVHVLKFRSMRLEHCDPTGVNQTIERDPRITRIGRFIRRTNIDELPQLFNVVKGDMSLVGPRCHPLGMLAAGVIYENLVANYHERHVMRPGITGLAQARGLRGPTTRPAKARARIAADIHYVKNFSLWLDLKIIYWTLLSEIRGGTGL